MGISSHPLFGSSLSFKELSRADNPKDRAHRRAHREETKIGQTRERDLDDGSSENYLGGEPFILFVDLVWVTSISSTYQVVDKSNKTFRQYLI